MRSFLTACLLLASAAAAFAETGGIRVVVVDARDHRPLPGVTVTLRNAQKLVATATAVTGADGGAEFPVLRAGGGYSVEVALAGYARQVGADLRVKIDGVTTVSFALSPSITETVTVQAPRETVSLEKTATATRFGDEFIENLPVKGRFYQNVLSLAAGVQDADGDGNPNVLGARDVDFKTQVNGISNQDPLTGKWMSYVNPDSIEELEVITAGAGAEYGRAQGGFANIIQKQGSNEFAGTFNLLARSSRLDGGSAVEVAGAPVPKYGLIQPAIQLSGPIVKDRVWYRVSHEFLQRDDPVNVLSAVAVSTTRRSVAADQITWQVSPRNKLAFQYQADPSSVSDLGVSSLKPADASMTLETGGPTASLSWTAAFSPRVLVDSVVSYQRHHENLLPSTYGVPNLCAAGDGLPFMSGAQCTNLDTGRVSGSYYRTWRDERERLTVRSQATLYAGRFLGATHQIKAGLDIENERYHRDLDRRPSISFTVLQKQFSGQPNFGNLAYVTASFAVPQRSDSRATGTSWGMFLEDQLKPRSNLTLTLGLRVDREATDSNGFLPFDPAAESDEFKRRAASVPSSQWAQIPSLVFTAFEGMDGFVWDLARSMGVTPAQVQIALSPTSIQSLFWNRSRLPGDLELLNTNLSPRLAVAWDPWSDGKTKLALTAGRYYDKVFLAVPLIELEPVTTTINFRAYKTPGATPWSVFGLWSGVNPMVNVQVVDRGLRTPYQNELTLSLEREIAPETSIKATYVYRRFEDQIQNVDLNHYAYDYGRCNTQRDPALPILIPIPDGVLDDCLGQFVLLSPTEPPVAMPDGYPDTYTYNPGWGTVFLVGNFNSAEYRSAILELTRRQYRNWQLEASYTWSRAIGDAEAFNSFLGDDRTALDAERGYLSYDQRHVFKLNATSITPWGFRIGTAAVWQSGLPYSIVEERLSADSNPPQYLGLGTPEPRVRIRYPTGQRNDQRNRSWWNFDLKLDKEMRLRGKMMAELSCEVFNLLNDRDYVIYDPFLGYGMQVNGTNEAYRRTGREYQLGLKVSF